MVLLTASRGPETELQSIEEGADLYITKPFDKDLLLARVENIFKTRAELRNYFFSEITLKQNGLKVSRPNTGSFWKAVLPLWSGILPTIISPSRCW